MREVENSSKLCLFLAGFAFLYAPTIFLLSPSSLSVESSF